MAREPILIGLDESPIVIQLQGTDWAFNPDPPVEFLIKMMDVAKSLRDGEFEGFTPASGLLSEQLTTPHQQKLWAKSEFGFANTSAVLMAYIGAVNSPFPTEPPPQSGKQRGGAGPKSSPAGTVKASDGGNSPAPN